MKTYNFIQNSKNRFSKILFASVLILWMTSIVYSQKPAGPVSQEITSTPTNSWVVKLKKGETINQIAADLGATSFEQLEIGTLKNYYLLDFSGKADQQGQIATADINSIENTLKTNASVNWSERNQIHYAAKKNWNDPLLGDQWHLNNTGQAGGTAGVDANVFAAWTAGYTGSGVQIVIVDDGVQVLHPDIAANFSLADSWDYNSNEQDPTGVNGDNHGTACAGVAAAIGNNAVGVSGVASAAKLAGIRLIAAGFTDAQGAAAMTFNMNNNDISSNSWGPTDNGSYYGISQLRKDALQDGATNGRGGLGTVYTWAAGNGRANDDNVNYDQLANSIYTIAVGAHTNQEEVSWYSEPGAAMLVSAPSNGGTVGITTTDLTGSDGYTATDYTPSFGGTSSACPLAAGVTALMLEANANLTWRDVQHLLVENGTKIDPTDADWSVNGAGYDINHNYGFGGLDAAALCAASAAWQNVAPATSDTLPVVVLNQPIPDNTGVALSTVISVASDMTIEHVQLVVEFTHTYAGDLEFRLTSPDGTQSILSETRDAGQNFANYEHTFMTVRNWGENSVGDWTVEVFDNFTDDVGTLHDVQLIIHGTDDTPCPGSLDLTGTTAYGSVPHNAGFQSPQFTVEALINANTISDDAGLTVPYENTIASSEYFLNEGWVLRIGDGSRANFTLGNGSFWEELNSPTGAISLNQTHHVAATYDGTEGRLYIDGQLVGSQIMSFSAATEPLFIGESTAFSNRHFDGMIDNVKIWNFAKTPQQMAVAGCESLSGNEPGLVAYYVFTDTPGVINDSSPNGLNGTIVGAAGPLCGAELESVEPSSICSQAIPVGICGDVVTGDNYCSMEQANTVCSYRSGVPTKGNWYTFTGDGNAITISACDDATDFDAVLYVYDGSCTALNCVDVDDDACGLRPELNFVTVSGTQYYVFIAGYSISDLGNYTLTFGNDADADNIADCDDFCPNDMDTAINFAGGNDDPDGDYIEVPHDPALNIVDGDFTIEAWIYSTGTGHRTIVCKGFGFGTTLTPYIFGIWDVAAGPGSGRLGLYLSGDWQFGNPVIPQNQWMHVAVSFDWDTKTASFYYDGILDGQPTYNTANTVFSNADTNPLFISRQGYDSNKHNFTGHMDDITIWDAALTQAEIQNNMSGTLTGNEGDLILHFDFNENPACENYPPTEEVYDISPNAHVGTLNSFGSFDTGCNSNWVSGRNLDSDGDGIGDACQLICPNNLALTNTLNTNTYYETEGYITSDQTIDSPADVDYNATTEISLDEGFEVKDGAIFHAYIDGCGVTTL